MAAIYVILLVVEILVNRQECKVLQSACDDMASSGRLQDQSPVGIA